MSAAYRSIVPEASCRARWVVRAQCEVQHRCWVNTAEEDPEQQGDPSQDIGEESTSDLAGYCRGNEYATIVSS